MPDATRTQLAYATTCYEQVAQLDTIPADHRLHLATMLRHGSPARAAWWLASYLDRPSCIPTSLGALLDLDPDMIIAAALVVRHEAALRTVLSPLTTNRVLQMHLPA